MWHPPINVLEYTKERLPVDSVTAPKESRIDKILESTGSLFCTSTKKKTKKGLFQVQKKRLPVDSSTSPKESWIDKIHSHLLQNSLWSTKGAID